MTQAAATSLKEETPETSSGPRVATDVARSQLLSRHFRRPVERPFTAEERNHVTILFGGLTWKHEKLIQAAFQGCGYRCQPLSNPTLSSYHLGRRFGNPGQCNPTYFTVGNLIQYLRELESQGLSKQEILDNYVFFTAGSCGPCRFGMYESEYRLALENAGFGGFRVLLFSQNDGVKAQSGEPGLKFNVDLGMGSMNAINLGDIANEIAYRVRPYEVVPGETDRVMDCIMEELYRLLRNRPVFEILERSPRWLAALLAPRKKLKDTFNTLGKVREHLYGKAYAESLQRCRECLNEIEVDRLRVKPIVKVTGEFWAQLTEGDGNFNMLAFLESEGAQVVVDSIGNWVMYLMHQAKANAAERKSVEAPHPQAAWWEIKKRLLNEMHFQKKWAPLTLGERIWARQYQRVAEALGNIAEPLLPQAELARLAHPFYHSLARGGEGHLEVGKNVYYTVNHRCHMVLALKPFGCMPSSQSDGVQSGVVNRFAEMIFLPIETAGEGEINAHSRVQMALTEAKAKARAEFKRCLEASGVRLEDVRAYVEGHPELRNPLYHVPRHPGVAGVAANLVLHVGQRMKSKARWAAFQVEGAT
jgi:predicted nucleotide-binding protein (sugar kinase/HSP70/actin superfamily)